MNLRAKEHKVNDYNKLLREYKAIIRDRITDVLAHDPEYKHDKAIKRLIQYSGYEVSHEPKT